MNWSKSTLPAHNFCFLFFHCAWFSLNLVLVLYHRPLVYVRERELREFAEREGLPVIPENCPACFESPKERHRTKQLLAQQA